MKKIIVLLICLLLCGCAIREDINVQLDKVFNNDVVAKNRTNNYTDYIEYYVPSDVNETDADALSFSFTSDGFGFIMNINVTNIINSEYYDNRTLNDEGFFDTSKLVYSKDSSFSNENGDQIDYFIRAYEYEDEYLLYFVTNELNFYGYASNDKVGLLAEKMVQMAANCKVNNAKVLADYSSIDVIDYEKKAVNLFENIYPVEGRVEDLMLDKTPEVSE